jgi:DNA mismatch repair protein MLH3
MDTIPAQDGRIRSLPPDVAQQVSSSVSITHLNEVVVELVKNSLDADAQSVTVTVDYLRGGCSVQDDGSGIPATAFAEGAGLASPYRELNPLDRSRSC